MCVALGTGRGKGGWLAIKQGEVGCLYSSRQPRQPQFPSRPPNAPGTGAPLPFGLRPDSPIQHAGHPATLPSGTQAQCRIPFSSRPSSFSSHISLLFFASDRLPAALGQFFSASRGSAHPRPTDVPPYRMRQGPRLQFPVISPLPMRVMLRTSEAIRREPGQPDGPPSQFESRIPIRNNHWSPRSRAPGAICPLPGLTSLEPPHASIPVISFL